ncbi:MAG: DNA mismatch repair protein MutS [Thermoplasmata archaeon]|nr:MAG: DNA mismatch repair protein MutS [Thermoplasmata archaeon]
MMQQYSRIKNDYKDSILFFRMGDFYETFYDDAKLISKELDIALTSRNKGADKKIPLAGIPYHALEPYLGRLIKKGYKVAICEQVEDPKVAKGIVKREVVRLVTPGTVLESGMLNERNNNFLMAIIDGNEGRGMGLAFVDVSTGEFLTTQLEGDDLISKLTTEIMRFKPAECLIPESLSSDDSILRLIEDIDKNILITKYGDEHFSHEKAYQTLISHFKTISLEGMGCETQPLSIEASGAVLSYLQETQKANLGHIDTLNTYLITDYMILDSTTLRNLEIVRNIRDGSSHGTLLEIMDKTSTSMGSRMMRKWLSQPLMNVSSITMRQNATEELFFDTFLRSDLKDFLGKLRDVERIIGRVVYGSANGRDLIAIKESLRIIPEIKSVLKDDLKSLLLRKINGDIKDLEDLVILIEKAIVDDPPLTVKEGGLIKNGFNEKLDELREISKGGKTWITNLEKQERRRTGIKSLRVRYNKVFGYYIEVTKANLSQVPDDYIRKQTLANSERFVTPDLKEKESLILSAEEKMNALEYELFSEVRESISQHSPEIKTTASALSELDCLVSFACLAKNNNYIKPDVNEKGEVIIKEGRHPVIEEAQHMTFIPNDTSLDCLSNRLIILTGPNMAGKSTYMRQVALITIMAQMGSFVPAKSATIGVVDRVYTRVGAFDDLTRGQSTFMVEMNELANILNTATQKSLIILDEIGRGTSTYDGLSIAWAVAEYIHNKNKIGAKTLFATHYHNLTELAEIYEGVTNYNIAIKEDKDGIIFLRKVVPGGTNKSYGIEVAKLAGIPSEVIDRANEVLKTIEEENIVRVSDETSGKGKEGTVTDVFPRKRKLTQLVLFEPNPVPNPVVEDIKKMNLDEMTPLDALNKLSEMKKRIDEEKEGENGLEKEEEKEEEKE